MIVAQVSTFGKGSSWMSNNPPFPPTQIDIHSHIDRYIQTDRQNDASAKARYGRRTNRCMRACICEEESDLGVELVVAQVQRGVDGTEGLKVHGDFLFLALIREDGATVHHQSIGGSLCWVRWGTRGLLLFLLCYSCSGGTLRQKEDKHTPWCTA